ncbi:MAG: NAD-dependent epimerase/dehydratase family protein [Rhodobacteraceae bacterium]|nr:NAD-dependent epimerase/dehydratase family protein [Paracoccaceae bacterium]
MTQHSRHIVIIGGNGFIGDEAVRQALASGHRVTSVGRSMKPSVEYAGAFDYVPGGLGALVDKAALVKTVDAVWHLASSTVPAQATADPRGDAQDNLLPLITLLEEMRRLGQTRLLYLSSGGAIYGPPEQLPIPETHPLRPASAYGATKLAAEAYIRLYQDMYGLRPVVIRPANPYGPGQQKLGVLGAVTTFVNAALNNKPITMWGDGSAVRDFVHVRDLVRLMLATLENPVIGAYNCGYGQGTSLNTLCDVVEDATGVKIMRNLQPARPFDPLKVVLDISKAKRDLDWSPNITLAQGVAELVTRS